MRSASFRTAFSGGVTIIPSTPWLCNSSTASSARSGSPCESLSTMPNPYTRAWAPMLAATSAVNGFWRSDTTNPSSPDRLDFRLAAARFGT